MGEIVGHDRLLKRERPARRPDLWDGLRGCAGRLEPPRVAGLFGGDGVRSLVLLVRRLVFLIGEEGRERLVAFAVRGLFIVID